MIANHHYECKSCGFEFDVCFDDTEVTEEEKNILRECPCGAICKETIESEE